ncbi:PIG-L deacetylase family protein [Paenibacillus sp. J2TS4]|uniref:PIG-L deacetylase family protein n=1 Tax=Paenibacillus sp. J2TS4 TaxID=2807194 RepID=UPI001B071204|nr:PIG-L family deacetylase [Paenibacillus sp. J2TS4]GIP35410.1 PIG-L domain-containing protein [Paenibacillus sp. J2TS4]
MTGTTIAGVFAHPDDETFGASSAILEMGRRGDRFVLQTFTPGDAGKAGRFAPLTKPELAERRKRELKDAADILGIASICQLDYGDGKLKEIPLAQLIRDTADFLNKERASIVLTFPEDGIYGHPDHVAVHYAVKEAVFGGLCPGVQKLYYYASEALQQAGRKPAIVLDTSSDWPTKAQALQAHETQLASIHRVFGNLTDFASVPREARYEGFVLAWERGVEWPAQREAYFTDGLLPEPN